MPDDLTALWDRLDTLVGYSVPRTLDGIAAAWPEGWGWGRCDCNADGHSELLEWYAFHHDWLYSRVGFPDTGDEYADRLRLTVAAREAAASDPP